MIIISWKNIIEQKCVFKGTKIVIACNGKLVWGAKANSSDDVMHLKHVSLHLNNSSTLLQSLKIKLLTPLNQRPKLT